MTILDDPITAGGGKIDCVTGWQIHRKALESPIIFTGGGDAVGSRRGCIVVRSGNAHDPAHAVGVFSSHVADVADTGRSTHINGQQFAIDSRADVNNISIYDWDVLCAVQGQLTQCPGQTAIAVVASAAYVVGGHSQCPQLSIPNATRAVATIISLANRSRTRSGIAAKSLGKV